MAEDAWQEECLITISREGYGDVTFQGLTETVDIEPGEKDLEGVALVNGGRVKKTTPEGDSTFTFEAYPIAVGTTATADDTAGLGFFDLLHSPDTSQPLSISNARTRNDYRVSVLWTSDTTVANAVDSCTTASESMRISGARGNFTSVKPSFTDGIQKTTVVYKTPAFNKSGDSNLKFESADTTVPLAALNAYTSTTAF